MHSIQSFCTLFIFSFFVCRSLIKVKKKNERKKTKECNKFHNESIKLPLTLINYFIQFIFFIYKSYYNKKIFFIVWFCRNSKIYLLLFFLKFLKYAYETFMAVNKNTYVIGLSMQITKNNLCHLNWNFSIILWFWRFMVYVHVDLMVVGLFHQWNDC